MALPDDSFKELLYRLGSSLADFIILLNNLRASDVWKGRLVTVTIPANKTGVLVQHGLGRAHKGAVVVLASATLQSEVRPAFVPPATDDQEAAVFVAAAASVNLQYTLWVF